jgi:ribosomal protein S18 acetylase RimI-like enzyme
MPCDDLCSNLEETVNFMVEDPFSGYGLRPVDLSDRAVFQPYFQSLSHPLSDYTFSQLYTWRNSLRILWKQVAGHLYVFANGTGDLTLLLPPIGDGAGGGDRALREAHEIMDAYNADHGLLDQARVEYVSDELLARFDYSAHALEPMGADYVYDVRQMIDLGGGDLASKRQAKNRFMRLYAHRVETYDPALHLDDCLALLDQWKTRQDAHHAADPTTNGLKRQKESLACELSLRSAGELGLKGMVVYARSNPDPQSPNPEPRNPEPESLRGFTFGEYLGNDQSSITIEKTDLETKGLAQFIFSEFCRNHWSDRPLVNAGDDWGLETLAWTKRSYRPVKMLNKSILRLRRPVAVSMALPPALSAEASRVRAATRDDLAAAATLEQTCFKNYQLSLKRLQYLQKAPTALFVVAETDGAVVGEGIALIRRHKSGCLTGRIYSLAVSDQCRGRKIGGRLLETMVEGLLARGVQRIFLEVESDNDSAIRLYQRHGFRLIGDLPDYYGPGRHGVHMMRDLSPAEEQMVFQYGGVCR